MKYIVYLFLYSDKIDFYICKLFMEMHVGFKVWVIVFKVEYRQGLGFCFVRCRVHCL
jgi:hypothetical protein